MLTVPDQLHAFRSSDCSTSYCRSQVNGHDFRGIDNGYLEGGAAISLHSRTYTASRFAVMVFDLDPEINPVEDFRQCVWDYVTRELVAMSDNIAEQVNALPRAELKDGGRDVEVEFIEPITLPEGQWVILGQAVYGEHRTKQVVIASEAAKKCAMGRFPQLGFNNKPDVIPSTVAGEYPTGGYTGGEPGPIPDHPSGNYPSMDLLPFP